MAGVERVERPSTDDALFIAARPGGAWNIGRSLAQRALLYPHSQRGVKKTLSRLESNIWQPFARSYICTVYVGYIKFTVCQFCATATGKNPREKFAQVQKYVLDYNW